MRYRSVLALVLGLVTVLLVSCGGPTETSIKPPAYTQIQLERIQQSLPELQEARERMQKQLSLEIQNQEWQNIRAFVHGPLGETLQDMNSVARNLAPQAQQDARQATRALFDDLVDIDEAAKKQNATAVGKAYRAALEDFDRFLQLVPPQVQARLQEAEPRLRVESRPEETVEIVPVERVPAAPSR